MGSSCTKSFRLHFNLNRLKSNGISNWLQAGISRRCRSDGPFSLFFTARPGGLPNPRTLTGSNSHSPGLSIRAKPRESDHPQTHILDFRTVPNSDTIQAPATPKKPH